MQINYKRSPNVTHMIVDISEKEFPAYAYKMIKANSIPGLLSFSESESNSVTSFWFDITAKKSLRTYFSQEGINRNTIYVFLKSLSDCMDTMSKYLLDPSLLLISPDAVFLKNEGVGWQAYFACVPQESGKYDRGLVSVMEYIIQNVDHADMDAVKISYKLYEMAEKQDTSISGLLEVLSESYEEAPDNEPLDIDVPKVHCDPYEDTGESEVFESIWEDEKKKKSFSIMSALGKIKNELEHEKHKRKKPVWDEKNLEDLILDPTPYNDAKFNNQTAILQGERPASHRLCYLGRGPHRDIIIDTNPLRIGSRDTDNDAVIKEGVVSRCHARITLNKGEYFLEDLESKNGTYLNGKILGFRCKERLSPGDRISFANVGYRFE